MTVIPLIYQWPTRSCQLFKLLEPGTPRAHPWAMAHVITQKCIGTCDTACVDVCPCDCIIGPISLDQLRQVPLNQRSSQFPGIQMFVDPDECIDCGACVAECPVAAIYLDDDLPDKHRDDIARNAAFFQR